MDGTLTLPNLEFAEMYRRCGVSPTADLLTAIDAMADEERKRALLTVEEMEEEGRSTLQLMPGATDLAKWLHSHSIPTAIVTRNTAKTVTHLHSALWAPHGLPPFSPAISRDDKFAPKPDPAAMTAVAQAWGVPLGSHLLMVGDSVRNDVGFGKAAGISTALVDGSRRDFEGGQDGGADMCSSSLIELPRMLWQYFVIGGKLGTGAPLQKVATPVPSTPVTQAAAAGDIAALESAPLQMLNAADDSGNTPLIWAADSGQINVVQMLLSIGVDSNVRGFLGTTAVSRACRRGDVPVLRCLLRASDMSSIDTPNEKMQTPLHFAAFKLHPEAVDVMLEHGASTTVMDRKGRTPAEDTSDGDIRASILAARIK